MGGRGPNHKEMNLAARSCCRTCSERRKDPTSVVVATACCLCRGHVPGSFKRKTHRSTSLTVLSLPKGGTKSVPWLPLLLACAISKARSSENGPTCRASTRRETSLVPRWQATTRTETMSLASQGILSPNNPSRGGYVQKSRTHQS